MTKPFFPDESGGRIVPEPFGEALSRRYLAYALSTIMHRALPDVRDGLKPVHRRILYSMRQLKLNPELAAKKCARVVGDVIGRFHPHGDQSVYDALVRLAQDFAQRYPLIDGQGNFGNIDGDSAAAMRYTECRLTDAAQLLLQGIDEDAVDFRATYDGEDAEPAVLPAGFPNLLANGSSGIAVGMATSIPPHNAAELIDASVRILEQPDCSTEDLMQFVPGPDFPTGGIIVEPKRSILDAYETGKGGVRLRARWETEELGRGQWRVIITEVPYQVQKSRLIEQLADLIESKKAPLLGDVRDESAEDVRVILEPKTRSVEPEVLMESLFKLSDLEVRFPININVLDGGAPKVLGLKACLRAFLNHRQDVLIRRSNWRLDKIEKRLHLLDGLLIAFLNLDEVIRIVREEDKPKQRLIEAFGLSDPQADYILDTRLRNLAKLEEMQIRGEHDALSKERDGLKALLGSEALQWAKIREELLAVRKLLLSARRSNFSDAPVVDQEAILESLIVREPITVIISERGWIRAAKGKVDDPSELKFKEGDGLAHLVPCETTDKLLLFSTDGRFFTIGADKLPSARGQGEPLRLMIDMGEGTEILSVLAHRPGRKLLMASKAGYGFIMPEEEAIASKKAGKQALNVEGQGALCAMPIDGDHLVILGENQKVLIFPMAELPEMSKGKGVKLQNYKGAEVRDLMTFAEANGPRWIDAQGKLREWKDWRDFIGKRASVGRTPPRGMRRLRP